jgi:glycosyltransferase involved in cell wall biosynthesis
LKVALVHDWLNQVGGAENVLIALKEVFPDAPVFTSIFDRERMPAVMRGWEVHTSALDRLPTIHRNHQAALPLYPFAWEGFDFSDFDVVLSNKSGFCHGIITPPPTLHLCYCLTPTRYLWSTEAYLQREGVGRLRRTLLPPVLTALRLWDQNAAKRVDRFAAISRAVQQRVAKVYRADSVVIYPPVDTHRFTPGETGDYFFIVSRLIPYKRIDLAVQAFSRLGLPLVIAGDGRDRAALEAAATPNIRFLGRVSDTELSRWMGGARAFIFPGEEDFGIAPLEAASAGVPVIAYAAGGALDTVRDGDTGLLFLEPTADSLADAVRRFESIRFDPSLIRAHAQRFDVELFKRQIREWVEQSHARESHCSERLCPMERESARAGAAQASAASDAPSPPAACIPPRWATAPSSSPQDGRFGYPTRSTQQAEQAAPPTAETAPPPACSPVLHQSPRL